MLGLGKKPDDLVFTTLNGEPYKPSSFSMELRRIASRADVGPVTFHALRHTHITDLLRQGVHPKIASERAGHSSAAATLDIYSHAVPGLQEDAAGQIDAALRALLGD